MISRNDLERLAALKSDHGILTAYLSLDPRLRFMHRQAATRFKGSLKKAQRRLGNSRWREALERESSRVLDFLSESDPAGRGVVIFASEPDSIWEVLPLEFAVPSHVDIDMTTKTGILAQALDEVPRSIVAVVQRDKSRIYIAAQGRSAQQADIESEVPGQHKQGGRAQMRLERHIDFHVAEHLKKVVDELAALAKTSSYVLVLGGTDEIVNQIETMLPQFVSDRLIGSIPVDHKHDSDQQILERAARLWGDREESGETELFEQILQEAKSGRRGVLGAEPTLSALIEEKVGTLLIANDMKIKGSVCTQCDYFSAALFKTCPLCGGAGEQRDVTDHAVEKAILTWAAVEIVSSGPARERLLAEGGVGALLRY